jgi:uncharacterized protein YigE (DUF2233 family)
LSRRHLLLLIGPLVILGLACNASLAAPTTPVETVTRPPTTPTLDPPRALVEATASPLPPDTGWQKIEPGLDYRVRRWFDAAGQTIETMHILRLDPAAFEFRVAYAPGAPQSVKEWAAQSGALITVNAGYFTPEYLATGLVIADGVSYGTSYQGFGGMVTVGDSGVDVRSLEEHPYDPSEPLTAAVQSFPMLVKSGGVLGYPEEDGIPSRRTVIGKDQTGRVLIILCPNGTFTLRALALELLQSDLALDVALNLDGGTSAGLWADSGALQVRIPSLVAVPTVLLIDARR